MRTLSLILLVVLSTLGQGSEAISTYPPSPEDRPLASEVLSTARVALFAGHPDQAYRLLLAAQPRMGRTPEWLDLAARVFLALDRPVREAECFVALGPSDPLAAAKVKAILSRQPGAAPNSLFSPVKGAWSALDKRLVKSASAVAPGAGGTLFVLGGSGLLEVGPDGGVRATQPLLDGTDLSLDFEGRPVALGQTHVIWGSQSIPLPKAIAKAASAAASPDGQLLVLDRDAQRLYRLGPQGSVLGSIALSLGDPIKVRADLAGRIYLADRDTGEIHVFSPDMAPLRVLTPVASGRPLRKVADLWVDLAGDVLVLDGSAREVALFSPAGQFLGWSGERVGRVDAAGWDGLNALVVLNRREAYVGRVGT